MPAQVSRHAECEEFVEADGEKTVYDFESLDDVSSQSSSPERENPKSAKAFNVGQAS